MNEPKIGSTVWVCFCDLGETARGKKYKLKPSPRAEASPRIFHGVCPVWKKHGSIKWVLARAGFAKELGMAWDPKDVFSCQKSADECLRARITIHINKLLNLIP